MWDLGALPNLLSGVRFRKAAKSHSGFWEPIPHSQISSFHLTPHQIVENIFQKKSIETLVLNVAASQPISSNFTEVFTGRQTYQGETLVWTFGEWAFIKLWTFANPSQMLRKSAPYWNFFWRKRKRNKEFFLSICHIVLGCTKPNYKASFNDNETIFFDSRMQEFCAERWFELCFSHEINWENLVKQRLRILPRVPWIIALFLCRRIKNCRFDV